MSVVSIYSSLPESRNHTVRGSQECDVPPAYQLKQRAKVMVWGGMTGCGLTKLHILQGGSQGGPGVPVKPPPPHPFVAVNDIIQTTVLRLEQRNLCHLQLASCTIDVRSPWTRAFFSPLHRLLISGRVYMKAVSHRQGSMTSKPRQN